MDGSTRLALASLPARESRPMAPTSPVTPTHPSTHTLTAPSHTHLACLRPVHTRVHKPHGVPSASVSLAFPLLSRTAALKTISFF